MVRTHHGIAPTRFDPSRIFAYGTALALHALALALLLIPLSQAPIRTKALVQEPRWVVADTKPKEMQPPPPLPPEEVKVSHAAPTRQPVLAAPLDSAPMPIFATEAVITAPVDIAPLTNADASPSIDAIGRTSPLDGVQLRYQRAPAPAYPRDALIAGAQGTVILRVLVGEDGTPLEVSIERSSGNRSLDNAARSQVLRRWKFQPATDGGHPVKAYGLIPVDFTLG